MSRAVAGHWNVGRPSSRCKRYIGVAGDEHRVPTERVILNYQLVFCYRYDAWGAGDREDRKVPAVWSTGGGVPSKRFSKPRKVPPRVDGGT